MKHFLARLADRARGIAPRVEPIIASHFAPVDSLRTELPTEIISEIETPDANPSVEKKLIPQRAETPPVEDEPPSRSRGANPPAARKPPQRAEQGSAENEAPSRSADAKIEPVAEPLLVRRVHKQTQSLLAETANPERQTREQRRETTAIEKQVAKPKSHLGDLKGSAARPLQQAHELLPYPAEVRDQPPIGHSKVASSENYAAKPQTRRARREPLRPVVHPNSVTGTPDEPRNEPPIVRITIGRIEVRAAPAPVSPSHKRPPPAPKLSLGDYLKQRNGGRL